MFNLSRGSNMLTVLIVVFSTNVLASPSTGTNPEQPIIPSESFSPSNDYINFFKEVDMLFVGCHGKCAHDAVIKFLDKYKIEEIILVSKSVESGLQMICTHILIEYMRHALDLYAQEPSINLQSVTLIFSDRGSTSPLVISANTDPKTLFSGSESKPLHIRVNTLDKHILADRLKKEDINIDPFFDFLGMLKLLYGRLCDIKCYDSHGFFWGHTIIKADHNKIPGPPSEYFFFLREIDDFLLRQQRTHSEAVAFFSEEMIKRAIEASKGVANGNLMICAYAIIRYMELVVGLGLLESKKSIGMYTLMFGKKEDGSHISLKNKHPNSLFPDPGIDLLGMEVKFSDGEMKSILYDALNSAAIDLESFLGFLGIFKPLYNGLHFINYYDSNGYFLEHAIVKVNGDKIPQLAHGGNGVPYIYLCSDDSVDYISLIREVLTYFKNNSTHVDAVTFISEARMEEIVRVSGGLKNRIYAVCVCIIVGYAESVLNLKLSKAYLHYTLEFLFFFSEKGSVSTSAPKKHKPNGFFLRTPEDFDLILEIRNYNEDKVILTNILEDDEIKIKNFLYFLGRLKKICNGLNSLKYYDTNRKRKEQLIKMI